MTADKRNTSVVVALVSAMTVGAAVLLWFQTLLLPEARNWDESALLMAEQGIRVDSVEVSYWPPDRPVDWGYFSPDESACWIFPDGRTRRAANGGNWHLVVVGDGQERLGAAQKRTLLNAVGNAVYGGGGNVPIRLAVGSDVRHNPNLPPQAEDLYGFLVRKRFIRGGE